MYVGHTSPKAMVIILVLAVLFALCTELIKKQAKKKKDKEIEDLANELYKIKDNNRD